MGGSNDWTQKNLQPLAKYHQLLGRLGGWLFTCCSKTFFFVIKSEVLGVGQPCVLSSVIFFIARGGWVPGIFPHGDFRCCGPKVF